ncbi:hypothetical protein [Nocardioides daphniae]|uniref:Uncharacterized protein n=1 Tax=Nocardioides daphniae TaxID=402297 RepID=A0A4P7U9H8_9ACTN|nr:hypothetical protein [Nocardioides daphniae]QCC76710.1 hypothetical protein E2C04_04800 [Nocardioides daphniae]
MQEVNLLCGGNAHLTEDELIGRIVEFAANGRHTFGHDEPLEAEHVRVLPAQRAFEARKVHGIDTDRPTADVWTICDRCDGHHVSTTGRTVLVPAGTAAIEFHVCLMCVDYLNDNFGPVQWKE